MKGAILILILATGCATAKTRGQKVRVGTGITVIGIGSTIGGWVASTTAKPGIGEIEPDRTAAHVALVAGVVLSLIGFGVTFHGIRDIAEGEATEPTPTGTK